MDYIINGFIEAFKLIVSLDSEIYLIVLRTLFMTVVSTIISSIVGIPVGIVLGNVNFVGKKLFSRLLYTMMSIPSVVVGLLVGIFLSRRGPLGSLDLMYTMGAMIIAQICLITPLITGIVFNQSRHISASIIETCKTLGANRLEQLIVLIKELKFNILIAIVTGFGRGISEVGAVMIVGGNIRNHTRTMTTFIAMNNSMGEYNYSIAMGLILLIIAFIVNSILYSFTTYEGGTVHDNY